MRSFFSAVRWCLALSWRSSKFYTLIRIAADIVTPLLTIMLAFVGKHMLDLLSGAQGLPAWLPQDTQTALLTLFALLFGIALVRLGSQKAVQYSQAMQSEMLNGEIALSMMKRSLDADLEYFDNPAYYDRLQSASQDAMAVSYILWNVLSCISASVSFIGAFAVLYTASPLYGLVMMAAAVPASIAAAKYTKLLYMLNLEQVNEHRQMYYCQHIASEKAFAQDMRLFGAGGRLMARYRGIWLQLFTKRKGMTRRRSVSTGLLACLPEMVVALIGVDIAFGVLGGYNTVGDYALFTGLAGQLWGSINMFSSSALQIYDNKLKIENIKRLDEFIPRVQDEGTRTLTQVETVSFEGVGFTYPAAKTPALADITFTVKREEKTVLVGLNGSGKSTLVKLLLRMYDPDTGAIYINGINIKEYKIAELRKNFSVYFQDMFNYNFTLRENFTIADPTHPQGDDAANAALQAAYGGDVLAKASKGMETSITRLYDPEGIELSGGQHQKLALARALYRRHTALILDEPSSNLDPKAEHEVFEALRTLTEGKLTLFTSHRLSNAALADRIIVLENGQIVEDGTQAQLLENKHRYAELFQLQKGKYE
ncbi:MAG: ABC transporter ATP-binding protein/permease [Defluviitaleaceae bacterium]|nr:ABC transporter ATP-binding protein/permease [Defluviitaleaceae bacterium]MCL2275125.1 ABC transporter ATP-binding protein/permease [Defluviitaleaceae bacterium]